MRTPDSYRIGELRLTGESGTRGQCDDLQRPESLRRSDVDGLPVDVSADAVDPPLLNGDVPLTTHAEAQHDDGGDHDREHLTPPHRRVQGRLVPVSDGGPPFTPSAAGVLSSSCIRATAARAAAGRRLLTRGS